jgi:hypothetical protein
MNSKYFNPRITGGISENNMDRRYAIDFIRDFWNGREFATSITKALLNTASNIILSGGLCSQGAGHTLNITACKGIVNYSVNLPLDWAVIPPNLTAVAIPLLVESTAQTNMAITSSVTDGTTPNYVKLAYLETPTNTRTKADDPGAGSYYAEILPSFTITVDSTAPTTYELLIATFTTNGSTIVFTHGETRYLSGALTVVSKSSAYTATIYDDVIEVTGTTTITLPPFTQCKLFKNKGFTIKHMDANIATIAGNGTNIDGIASKTSMIQYESLTIIPGVSQWIII